VDARFGWCRGGGGRFGRGRREVEGGDEPDPAEGGGILKIRGDDQLSEISRGEKRKNGKDEVTKRT